VRRTFASKSVTWAQLEPGSFEAERRAVRLDAMRIGWHGCNLGFKAEADLEPETSLIGILGGPSTDSRWFGADVDASHVAVSGESVWLRTAGAAEFFSVRIDAREIGDRFPNLPDARALIENTREVRLERRPLHAEQLRKQLQWLLRDSTRSSRTFATVDARAMLGRSLLVLLADVVAGSKAGAERSPSLNRRIAAVRVCEAYISEHMDAAVTLVDLSRISGLRLRSLINAFRAITGFSPMAYFKRQRLSAVRQALQRCDKDKTRVIDVATRWGFWHMGHFAADYREMFGEVPSRTLRTS
jgi:AraC family transcriptional regulator, ethanolamine operon transcriptional activator